MTKPYSQSQQYKNTKQNQKTRSQPTKRRKASRGIRAQSQKAWRFRPSGGGNCERWRRNQRLGPKRGQSRWSWTYGGRWLWNGVPDGLGLGLGEIRDERVDESRCSSSLVRVKRKRFLRSLTSTWWWLLVRC